MNNGKMMRRLLSLILIFTMVLVSIASSAPFQVQAKASMKNMESTYLNASEKHLHLGMQGANTYNFKIKKTAMKNVATYFWYVKKDKGDPNAVAVNKKTGVVTAKKVGTAYIMCKITLANGKILRQEAKVIVINNITKVEISNIPTNKTITAGTAVDFNHTILNTEAGKGKTTQGITRWEILNDTAGVETATSWGIVLPTKAGRFEIRAVCFQSNAKYKQWLADKRKYAGNITAVSKWATIDVASSNGTAIATKQEQLVKLLAADNITQITISTKSISKLTIPKGDYDNKNLIVDAPNVDVENNGVFKKITLNDFKNGTWSEFSKGNRFDLLGDQTHMIVDKSATIDEVIIDSADTVANFKVDGNIIKITIENRAKLNIVGSGTIIPVTLESPSAGSTITSSLPINLDIKASADIILNAGAEDSIIDKNNGKADVKIVNNLNKDIVITIHDNGNKTVGAGETVIFEGNTTPLPTSTPSAPNSSVPVKGTAITGVTAPVLGATPVATATETAEYTATVTWSTNPVTFAAATIYTATISLTAKPGYTLTGITANQFTVAGATTVSNPSNSGLITAVFPATAFNGTITVTNHRDINVTGLALGDVVKVYDTNASTALLGTGTVVAGSPTAVSFPLYVDLSDEAGSIYITITSPGKPESARIEKQYGAVKPGGNILATLTASGTVINLAYLQANATGLEATVSIDGTTYSSYAPITVDSIGNASIASLVGVSESSKVKIRVAGTGSTVPGDDKELAIYKIYDFDAATNTITNYYPHGEENLVIPATIDGVAVKKIEQQAISNCSNLKTVTIPDGVETLAAWAIEYCNNLETITIGKDVTSIEREAVSGCSSIIVDAGNTSYLSDSGVLFNKAKTTLVSYPVRKADSSYSIPTGVDTIGEHAFDKNSYIQTVTIPDGVTTIGKYAFGECVNLTNPVLPGSVTTIKYYAFYNCNAITSITIPSSVATIEDYVFYSCDNLTSAYFEGNAGTMGINIFAWVSGSFILYYHGASTGFDGLWCSALTKQTY